MNSPIETLRSFSAGSGGMVFIVTIGLAVLIFGGIVVNTREGRDLQAAIGRLENSLAMQAELKPILLEVEAHRTRIEAIPVVRGAIRSVRVDDIPALREELEALAVAAGLHPVSARPILENRAASFSLSVDLRLTGSFQNLSGFLERISQLSYQPSVEEFFIQTTTVGQEMQLVLRFNVS